MYIDEAAEKAGGYVVNTSNTEMHYNIRKIANYCKEKGINSIDLTIKELNQFIFRY